MSSTITALPALSRPKIHRLPAPAVRAPRKRLGIPKRAVFWTGVTLAFLSASFSIKTQPVITAATTLPAVAVVSNRIIQADEAEGDYMLPAAIGDAQAAPALPLDKSGSTIWLQDNSSAIIGQMAKIPLENEHITEIKAINDIDNGAGRELLSIISKY
jgi:hypothetical protein